MVLYDRQGFGERLRSTINKSKVTSDDNVYYKEATKKTPAIES